MLGTLSVDTCNFYLVVQLYLFYITHLFLIDYQGLFNYSKVERVLTPLVFIDFAIFCAKYSSVNRFILFSFTLSLAYNC